MKKNDGQSKKKSARVDMENLAIKVENISKTFRVPHQKVDSVRSIFVNLFSKKRTYEEFKALDGVSFEVKKGDFVGIIGHNGSGKSTLLKCLAGVYKEDSGSIEVDGRIAPFLELGIGFNPELSGRDNIYLNATILGMSKKEIDEKIDDIIDFSEIRKFIDQNVKNYSSGMRGRLAFSVSIHANRDILLMDEVLAVGDARFQQKCFDVFKNYKKQKRTVILVTHSMNVVREYCDSAILLYGGKIIKSGDVNNVCDEYVLKNMSVSQRQELEKRELAEKKERTQMEKLKVQKKKDDEKIEKKNNDAVACIFDVNSYDENGKKLQEITDGDNFSVKISINVKKVTNKLGLAVQILDHSTNNLLCGNNTKNDKFHCEWTVGANSVRIDFQNTNFNTGEIYIRAVLFELIGDARNIIEMYPQINDKNKNVISIIKQGGSGGGVMRIDHKWSKK